MKNKEVIKSDITFIEVCQVLKKSRKTISRYIKKGLLKPERIKSKRGTLEYRFNQVDLESLKIPGTDKIRQDIRGDTRQAIRQDSEVVTLLKETTQVLRDQLTIKDKQIKSLSGKIDQLIERSRETNVLLKGLTNKVLMLEGKTEKAETVNEAENKDKDREDRQDKKRQDRGQKIKDFIRKLFKN
ncbi:unnamed protein product [marine sediment metagenome]|uniref:Helix-turn-helix domain-containing protein n=1 Tax=marine sediment metagenome TaxID=412755 RepID=X1N1B1_9ZZZZ